MNGLEAVCQNAYRVFLGPFMPKFHKNSADTVRVRPVLCGDLGLGHASVVIDPDTHGFIKMQGRAVQNAIARNRDKVCHVVSFQRNVTFFAVRRVLAGVPNRVFHLSRIFAPSSIALAQMFLPKLGIAA